MTTLTKHNQKGASLGDEFGSQKVINIISDGNYIFQEKTEAVPLYTEEAINNDVLLFSGEAVSVDITSLTVTTPGKYIIIGQSSFDDVDDVFPSLQLKLKRAGVETVIGQDFVGQDLNGENVISTLLGNYYPTHISIVYDLQEKDELVLSGYHPITDADGQYATNSRLTIIKI